MAHIMQFARLEDHGVILEYQLPLTSKRLDCMICGRDEVSTDQAVIVELKQWERCQSSTADKLVTSWVGGMNREVLHPSVQVGQYQQYLSDTHSAFYEDLSPVHLSACSYLHNYVAPKDDPIRADKFRDALASYPLFDSDSADALGDYLNSRLGSGEGEPVLQRIEASRYKPSKKLMDHVAETIRSKSPWILLDEQLVIFQKILGIVQGGLDARQKQVVIVHGGPGTGKSVIAINLLADLLRLGINAQYAT
jgi:hypothetical protein